MILRGYLGEDFHSPLAFDGLRGIFDQVEEEPGEQVLVTPQRRDTRVETA